MNNYFQKLIPFKGHTRPQSSDMEVVNAGGIDRGLGVVGVGLTSSQPANPLKSFDDMIIVERTIKNARQAVEIDPTLWSSLVSMVMVANAKPEIVGDDDANPKAVDHIKEKAGLTWEKQPDKSLKPVGWNLDNLISEFIWKSLVDGKTFIRKHIPADQKGIQNVDFFAYDEKAYNFLELKDPLTNNIVGYVQKAMVYEVPEDWRDQKFDSLKNRKGKEETFHFEADEVIHTKFLERDNKADSPTMRVLDDVWALKYIKNMGPIVIERAATTVGVEVGNEKGTIKPYEDNDTYEQKKAKVQAEMATLGETFAKKIEKDVITHSYGVRPYMLGDGKILDISPIVNVYKQEIRIGLLTPDSRFESQSSNRSVSQEQLGQMGQMPIMEYIRGFTKSTFEPKLFDHDLELNGFQADIGKIHIKFKELKVDDELTMAKVGAYAMKWGFNLPDDLIISSYYGRLDKALQKYKIENPDFELTSDPIPDKGIVEQPGMGAIVNSIRNGLIREGVVEVIN